MVMVMVMLLSLSKALLTVCVMDLNMHFLVLSLSGPTQRIAVTISNLLFQWRQREGKELAQERQVVKHSQRGWWFYVDIFLFKKDTEFISFFLVCEMSQ